MKAAGLDNFVPLESWCGIVGPAGLPESAVKKFADATKSVLQLVSLREALKKVDADSVSTTPAEMTTFMSAESAKWNAVVPHLGIPKI